MIKFDKVTKNYPPDISVLQEASFEISKGEFVCIVGKSGAGKTTLIKLLLGLERPDSGEIFFNDKKVNNLKPRQLQDLRRKIGVVYQDYKLLPNKTVYENVAYIMAVKGKAEQEIRRETRKVLETTGLSDKTDNFPEQLSGGEQQRLAVARAVVSNPEVIIADEPTGNLDPYNTYEVVGLLKKFHGNGKTIILFTHDKEVVNKLGKRVITLDDGRVVRDDAEGRFIL